MYHILVEGRMERDLERWWVYDPPVMEANAQYLVEKQAPAAKRGKQTQGKGPKCIATETTMKI
jgi:hypothetical protein